MTDPNKDDLDPGFDPNDQQEAIVAEPDEEGEAGGAHACVISSAEYARLQEFGDALGKFAGDPDRCYGMIDEYQAGDESITSDELLQLLEDLAMGGLVELEVCLLVSSICQAKGVPFEVERDSQGEPLFEALEALGNRLVEATHEWISTMSDDERDIAPLGMLEIFSASPQERAWDLLFRVRTWMMNHDLEDPSEYPRNKDDVQTTLRILLDGISKFAAGSNYFHFMTIREKVVGDPVSSAHSVN